MSEKEMGERIEKIEKLDKVSRSAGADIDIQDDLATTTSRTKFDNAYSKATVSLAEPVQVEEIQNQSIKKPSLIDELGISTKGSLVQEPVTVESIQERASKIRTSLEPTINETRTTSEQVDKFLDTNPSATVNFPPVEEAKLSGKVVHIEAALKSALRTAGVEVNPHIVAPDTGSMKNPVVKFLNFLTQNDNQLKSILDDINNVNKVGSRLGYGDLLAVQVKLGFAQQQLELFANILNKALESIKTVMNVQV